MKILISTESYYPTISGVAVFSHYLALGLVKRGHEVHVICPSTRLASFEEVRDGVHIHRVRSRPNPFRKGHRNSFMAGPIIRQLVKEIHPDVAHIQDPLPTAKRTLQTCQELGIPVVMTNHFGFDYILSYLPWVKPLHPYIAKILEVYLTALYNGCDYITFPSETIRKEFITSKLTTPSVAASNGVNLDQFYPSFNFDEMKQKLRIPNKPIILHVGRLDKDKKSMQVIKSFILVRQKIDAHLIVCGEGGKKAEMIEMAEKSGNKKNVTFVGFINHRTELPQIYQMSNLFVTASTIETQGIVALEAMASGLPLVVPNAGALPELCKDGVNGYLFEPDNEADMAAKIEKVLTDLKAAKTMGDKGLEMVEEHEIEQSFDRFESIYKQLAASKKSK